jgi:predicted nuclease of restriction endonuclease-like (RecB) superfamily
VNKNNQIDKQGNGLPSDYGKFLADIKARIRQAQIRAGLAVNSELILLYWNIGRDILTKQKEQGWGAKVVDRLSKDLCSEFPSQKGYSSRNLKYMRLFAEAWPDEQIVQQAVAQIPWGHNVRILDALKDVQERLWYVRKTIENGWSRAVLVHQIESGLYERQGSAQTNFERALPAPQSELAGQILKDPYNFDFLELSDDHKEREFHRGLLDHIRAFLLELGTGFAFVGSEYHLEVGQSDFYIDLLFYHLKLRSYVVIELKTTKFQPEYAGKMNFYLSAIDDLLRHPDDQPSIGIILCKGRDSVVAEYALRDTLKPIGVSGYELTKALPETLQDSLPTIEQLEEELDRPEDGTDLP